MLNEMIPIPADQTDARRDSTARLIFVAIFAAGVAGLVLGHFVGINGSTYFLWLYRRIAWWRIYPALFAAAMPFLLSQLLLARSARLHARWAIFFMMLTTFSMQIAAAGMPMDPWNPGRIATVIQDAGATSYFTDAQLISRGPVPLRQLLDQYETYLPHLTFHSQEKPPGPILYFLLFLKGVGSDWPELAALLAGVTIGLVSTFSIPLTYWFVRTISDNRRVALAAAGYLCVSPSMVMVFPSFDAIYPIFTCAILGSWVLAMRDDRPGMSALFGAALSVAIFFSYCHLVLGAFVVLYALVQVVRHGREGMRRFAIHSAIGLGTVAAIYTVLWLVTGFNPIATFWQAVLNQEQLVANLFLPRPYPQVIPGDYQDFLLGSAWISLPLILFWLLRQRKGDPTREPPLVGATVLVGLAQVVIVGLTGLLPGETARVWLFLQPLAMLPIGLELSRWGAWQRIGVYVIVVILATVATQNFGLV